MGLLIIVIIILLIIWLWKKELFSPSGTSNSRRKGGPPPPRVVSSFNCGIQRAQPVSTLKNAQAGMYLNSFPKCPVCHANNKEGRREILMTSQGKFKCVNGHVFTGKER